MRLFGVTSLLILGALALSHAADQDNHDINLNDFVNARSPEIGYEDAITDLIQGPFFREATWQETSEYLGGLNGNELTMYIGLLEHYMDDEEVERAHFNEQETSLDYIVGGHHEDSVVNTARYRAEASGSGSGSSNRSAQTLRPLAPKTSHGIPADVQAWVGHMQPIYEQMKKDLNHRFDCPFALITPVLI
ncbi:hypothetical protein H4R33_005507 [Dimargaris cristalligena]|nr:hypothetical protein H4R33_005507 [Dimargaris cristalligena]